MRRKLKWNSLFILVVPLIAVVIAAMATAARGQINAARPPLAFKNHRHIRGVTEQPPPLFSQPLVYNDAGNGVHSVAIADLNGDGKPDVIVANSSGIAVLLANGDGSLQTPAEYSGGAGQLWWPGGLGVADLRKNGKLDAVVANYGGGNGGDSVGVLLGNGDGTFQAAVLYDSGDSGGIGTLILADLNGDGKTDVILFNANGGSGRTGSITALLGNGDGTFQPGTMILENTGEYGWGGIAVADLNGDGKLDLVVTMPSFNSGSAYVSVLLGNGNGTFQPPVNYAINGGLYLTSMTIADVNDDGKLDLVVGNLGLNGGNNTGGVSVLLGNGDGTFQPMQSFGSGVVDSISVADVNGDGNKDLVVTCCAGEGASGVVGVLLGNGDGTFQDQVNYEVGTGIIETMAAAVADMNGDGKMDVVAADLCYVEDPLGNCVPPGAVSVLLHAYSTTTAVVSALNPSIFGQSVTLTASVSASFGIPSGTVEFLDGSNGLGSGTLANGSTAISVSSLAVGSHSITAAYQGGPGYNPSTSSALNQVVTTATTTTSLASSMNPATINEYVTYTATVASKYGGAATGTAIFQDGGVQVAVVTLSGNQAAYTTNYSTVSTHTITVTYSGDANNAGSLSAPLVEQVIQGLTTKTIVTTSGSPSFVGEPVTFTATVKPKQGAIPDGELVTFYDGKTAIGTGTTASGVATFVTSSLKAETHTIKAAYPGDETFEPSAGSVKQVVDKYPTTTALSSSLNPSDYGQAVTFTATVTSSGPTPIGKVVFKNGTKVMGSAALSGGVATLTTSKLAVGSYSITAEYLGDANSAESTSPVLDQVVQ
ncbi:MAG: Ig-like domain repeat protein [Terriglobales bacterium]